MSWLHPKVLLISKDCDEEWIAQRVVTKALGTDFELERFCGLEEALATAGRGGIDVVLVGERQGGREAAEVKREVAARGCPCPVVLMHDPDRATSGRDLLLRMRGRSHGHLQLTANDGPIGPNGADHDEAVEILRGLYDATPVAMGVVELAGQEIRGVSCNAVTARLLGIEPEMFVGQTPDLLGIASLWVTRWTEGLRQCADDRRSFMADYSTEHMGQRRWFKGFVNANQTPVGAAPRFCFVGFDVTEQKEAEENVTALNSQLQRRLDQVKALYEIDRAIASGNELTSTLGVVLDQAIARLGISAAAVRISEGDPLELAYVAHRGYSAGTVVSQSPRVDERSPAGRAVLERRPKIVLDLRECGDAPPEAACSESLQAYAAFPLLVQGEVRGVLEVGHRAPLAPDTGWIEFLQDLTGQAALAVDAATRAERRRRAYVELTQAFEATLEGWSRAVDHRDHETEGHSRRVTEMTTRLARELGVGDDQLVQVRRGALLHDIGKMGVIESILRKPGPLSDDEWVAIRTHPQRAVEMLAPIPYLRAAMDIPYCHHELWDGSGYPRGLKGEQIPLAARIFTAVDIWDALSHDRPFRAAWPREQVETHLRALAGTHLDPAVASLLLQTLAAETQNAQAECALVFDDPRR